MHPTARLPRAWWFPDLKGYRSTETGTYVCYPLDEQPKVSAADDEFRWLEDTPERDDGIKDGEPGQQTRPLTTEHLAAPRTGLAAAASPADLCGAAGASTPCPAGDRLLPRSG
jgi:hypothetical protein